MNCERTREMLDAWIDGELRDAERNALRAHVVTCDACERHEAAARRLRDAVADLPGEVEPGRDLWDGIQDRIAPRASTTPQVRTPRWALVAVAASVILAVTLGVVVLRDAGRAPVASVPEARPDDVASVAILASYDAAEDEFRETRDLLLAELESNRDRLDPETVEVVEDNLEIMNRAAAEIREALEHDPENRMLRSMLLASYRKQVGLLKHFGEIPSDL